MINIQDFRCYSKRQLLKLFCLEQMLFSFVFFIGFLVAADLWVFESDDLISLVIIALLYNLIASFCLYLVGLYKHYMNVYLQEQYLRAFVAVIILFVILNNISYWNSAFDIGKASWVLIISMTYIGLLISRSLFYVLTKLNGLSSKAVVLGASNKALQLKNNIDNNANLQTGVVGYICKPGERDRLPRECMLDISIINNKNNELLEYCQKHNINTVVVAVDDRRSHFPLAHLLECKQSGINILDLMEFYEQELQREELSILDPSWIIYSSKLAVSKKYANNKRAFDFVLSLIFIVLTLPVLLLFLILLKINYKLSGPVLSKMICVGLNGGTFTNYKFNCYNKCHRLSIMGRLIKRFKLENLPMLFNILRGDLSFVGPQIIDKETDQILSDQYWFFTHRYIVRPGLVSWGYNHIQYQSLSLLEHKHEYAKNQLQYDIYYLNKSSLLFDVLILLNKVSNLWVMNLPQDIGLDTNLNLKEQR